jgi:hypothetical protein
MKGQLFNKYSYNQYGSAYDVKCKKCHCQTWHKDLIDGICLFCVLLSTPFDLKIVLGESKSKSYKKAKSILKSLSLSNAMSADNEICICAVKDLCGATETVKKLISVAGSWKSFKVTLNGIAIPTNTLYDLMNHLNRILDLEQARAVSVSATGFVSFDKGERPIYAEGDCVVVPCQMKENLPCSYVCYPSHYGAFIGFRELENSEVYLCDCSKEAFTYFLSKYDNMLDIKKNFPKPVYENIDENRSALEQIRFRPNLRHVCNQTPPKLRWCIPMYGSDSDLLLGWYFKQEKYKCHEMPTEHNLKDDVRLRAGIIRWVSETQIYQILRSLLPGITIETHAHPSFLEGLEYDIYVPTLNLAIEYQGIQHYQPIDYFGGETAFAKVKERDEKKSALSLKHNIDLVYFDYTEDINETLIKSKLEKYL